MQVRAYNYWAGLLGKRSFPAPDRLLAGDWPDFAPHAVLLHWAPGAREPAVLALGAALAAECGDPERIAWLSEVPGRSVLARIAEHYHQIIATAAPVGFEAEFINARGAHVLYRGILLPFSSDGVMIDFICGVINWKELADPRLTRGLQRDLGRALETAPPSRHNPAPLPPGQVWADGPGGWADAPLDPLPGWRDAARALPGRPLHALPVEGAEFALVLVHRRPGADPLWLGEVPCDAALLARAVQRLHPGGA